MKLSNKINKHINNKFFINYLTKIASNILKIQNPNDIIILHKSKNIYEIFKNHNNYLTVKIFNYNTNNLDLYIIYNNIEYNFSIKNYKSKTISIIECLKIFNNIYITLIYSPLYEFTYLSSNKYLSKNKYNIKNKTKINKNNYNTIIYFFNKKFKLIEKKYSWNKSYLNINYYEYNNKIYIKNCKTNEHKHEYLNRIYNYYYKNNYLSIYLQILNIII